MKKLFLLILTLLVVPSTYGYLDKFEGLKEGIYFNYLKVGFYHDGTASSMSDEEFEKHLIEIKEIGFSGIMFELSVSLEDDGTLLGLFEYEKLKKWITLTKENSMGVSILPNWTFNGENAVYVNNSGIEKIGAQERFSIDNYFDSMVEYWSEYSQIFEELDVDLLYIGNFDEIEFLKNIHRDKWEKLFSAVRKKFSGAVTINFHKFDLYNDHEVSDIKIWDLTDAISVWGKLYISEQPIYDYGEIQKNLWGPAKNLKGFVQEYLKAAETYEKPIMLISNAFALDNGLDGGWDPTEEQLADYPNSINYEIFNTAYKSIIHHFNNHLSDYLTSWSFGNWEAWGFTGWNNWFHYDLSQFPSETKDIFQDLFEDNVFLLTNRVDASSDSEIITVPSGFKYDWEITSGGGADTIRTGDGNDTISITNTFSSFLKLNYDSWTDSKNETLTLNIYIDDKLILQKEYANNNFSCPNDNYPCWATFSEEIDFTLNGNQENLYIEVDGAFIDVKKILLGKGAKVLALKTSTSDRPELPEWALENYIVENAKYDISEINDDAEITVIGGKGLDILKVQGALPPNTKIRFSQIERILDKDIWVAYDTGYKTEAAGRSIKIIAATFGVEYINDKEILGKAIKYFDDGLEQSEVVQKMVDEKLGENASYDEIVETVLFNIFDRQPINSEIDYFASFLESGQYTVGKLILAGANHPKNIRKINWAELEKTGIEYTPVD